MDPPCAATAQEGEDSKDPAVAPIAPSLPGLLVLKPCLLDCGPTETQAVSMANTDSTPTLPSSPAEASLAKLAIVSPTDTADGTADIDGSPAPSDIAPASDSLPGAGQAATPQQGQTTIAPAVSLPSSRALSSNGDLTADPHPAINYPSVLTFKGISVSLENNSVWKQFHRYGTEMILTKGGRRMFPYCRYRLSGLVPTQSYSLVLSIIPADQHKYRWNTKSWEVIGAAEHQAQGLIRAFSHQNSPSLGSEWMSMLVSFYKLKLTNNVSDQQGHMILHSMHRYIPRLHVIPVLDVGGPTPDQPVVMGPESMTFTFLQTEFVSVTTYQNPWIIELKINHNPFAKGFREDTVHPRLAKPKLDDSVETKEAKSPLAKPAGDGSSMEISSRITVLPCSPEPTGPTPLCAAPEPEDHAQPAQTTQTDRNSEPDVEVMDVVPTEQRSPSLSPAPTPLKRPRGRPRKRRLEASPAIPPRPPPSAQTRSSRAAEESDDESTPTGLRKKKRVNRK